jgi:6-phosphogluconate dehydrogenase
VQGRANSQLKLQQRFEAAREEGDLPNGIDSAVLASFVMAIAQGMAVQAKASASQEALEKMATHVLSTWPLPAQSV